jgi:hypothetical protein
MTYLVPGLVGGTLLTNVWDEAASSGFVQHRLMDRRALVPVLNAGPGPL